MRGSSACRLRPTRAKTSKSLSGTSANRSLLTGALLGVATFAVYMIGSNRSFGYDAAATIANFVATPSLLDAFAVRSVIPTIPVTQVAGNDHVLVSLLSHVIYSATGSRNEVVYRLLPALGAGATVGLSTGVLVRRFGLLAGLCAGLYIATDPLFVDNSRDVRGYSLAALGSAAGRLVVGGRRGAGGRFGIPLAGPPAVVSLPAVLRFSGPGARLPDGGGRRPLVGAGTGRRAGCGGCRGGPGHGLQPGSPGAAAGRGGGGEDPLGGRAGLCDPQR